MTEYFYYASKSNRVRCRQEDDDNFLLYHAATDELHMVSRTGKAIFDMCDGRSIDDIVNEGAGLLHDSADPKSHRAEVLSYICALRKRALIEVR